MYHGIGPAGIDPWGLLVSPENFADHLRILADSFHPAPLSRLIDGLRTGDPAPGSVAVTFDDGYANVGELAEPLLNAQGIPATLFVISRPLATAAEYWWDELAHLVLQIGDLPPRLELGARDGNRPIELDLGPAAGYSHQQWRLDHDYCDGEGEASPRMELYRTLWERLSPLDHDTRQDTLSQLACWAGRDRRVRDSHRSLTVDELVALDGDTVEIGGHTVTHPLLPGLGPDRLRSEIEDNKHDLEDLLGRELRAFSYPFGANDLAAVEAVGRAGYQLAVTTRPDTVSARPDPLRIGRFDVKNWPGAEFEARLRRWIRFR
jgi:peptidoglycan/xylan/chitin deacetylase (PgdA/CDA1 family)